MVIYDLHIARPGGQVVIFIRHLPDKTNAPLVVDAYAVLPGVLSF